MKINHVTFQTQHTVSMQRFYTETLGFTLVRSTNTHFTIKAGHTHITFEQVQDSSTPTYHFAFNIPENQYDNAKAWAVKRVELVKYRDEEVEEDEIFFRSWNAHSFYFFDPNGNIVEMIARHNLANATAGSFDISHVIGISEVGLPVDDVLMSVERLQKDLGVPGWREVSETFSAIGDEEGLFILVKKGRIWFMSEYKADMYPTTVHIRTADTINQNEQGYRLQNTPYVIYP